MERPLVMPACKNLHAFNATGSDSIKDPMICSPSRVSTAVQEPMGLSAWCCHNTENFFPPLSVRLNAPESTTEKTAAYPVNPTPALLQIAGQHGWQVFYPDGIPAV